MVGAVTVQKERPQELGRHLGAQTSSACGALKMGQKSDRPKPNPDCRLSRNISKPVRELQAAGVLRQLGDVRRDARWRKKPQKGVLVAHLQIAGSMRNFGWAL